LIRSILRIDDAWDGERLNTRPPLLGDAPTVPPRLETPKDDMMKTPRITRSPASSPWQTCRRAILTAAILMVAGADLAPAAEGGLGRPITGMQVVPFAGVIPPDPGFIWQTGFLAYSGEIEGSVQTPIGGELVAGLDVDLSLFTATGIYVWQDDNPRWDFASMITVPYIMVDVDAQAGIGGLQAMGQDDDSDLFDLFFAPIIASWHKSEVEHWSFALYAYAPTADYEVGRLANPGLNVWTWIPSVGYTRLFKQGTVELSGLVGVEFYSENDDTGYQNGEIFRLDLLAMKRYANGWGLGLVGGMIEQLSGDDGGALTELTNGFEGHSLGAGLAASWTRKTSRGNQIDLNLRWVSEFDVENRFEGDAALLSLGFTY
jgi:hypothetical protein